MIKSGLSLKPSEEYAHRLRRQLEECSADGTGCELCNNAVECRKLYDMLPIFISKDNYQRYSREFESLKKTKETNSFYSNDLESCV